DAVVWRQARAAWLLNFGAGEQDVARAAGMLNDIIRAAPQRVQPHVLLARAQDRLGNATLAPEQMQIAEKLHPGATAITLEVAQRLAAEGDRAGAKERLDRVLAAPGSTAADQRLAAAILAQIGESDAAAKALEKLKQDSGGGDLLLAQLCAR